MLGKTVAGYFIEEKIGAGGFGTVHRATQPNTTDRAIKFLNPYLLDTDSAVQRFEREIATLRRLGHPGSIKVFESGRTSDGIPYFFMEFLRGRDLNDHISDCGRLSHSEILDIMKPICHTLQSAHEHDIIHRDIKASNVFLCSDGRIILLDFGIAKILTTPGMTLTKTNQVVGTACAMSPEQLSGKVVSKRTDVYGLGSLVFHMLTGRMPFLTSSLTLTQVLHGHAARVPPSNFAPSSPMLDSVVTRAMGLEVKDRQEDCEHFYRELRTAVLGTGNEVRWEAKAVVVHVLLGPFGNSVEAAKQAWFVLARVSTDLQEANFQMVAKRMRGLCYARILSEDSHAATLEEAKAKQTIALCRDTLVQEAPKGSTLSVQYGILEILGAKIQSGQALEVPR